MRRVALVDYGKLELQENLPGIEKLQPGTVKIDVTACGVCGSDISLYRGGRSLEDEHYFGHEFSGVIVDEGKGANGIRNGMRVASELSRTCGKCWNCTHGLSNYCKSMNDALLPGGFSEETLVLNQPDFSWISAIPQELDAVTATLLEPTNCSYHTAVQAKVQPGDTVAVIGLGAIGIITACILKSMGAGTVIGIQRSQARLEKVRALGLMDELISTSDPQMFDKIREISGGHGADVVIESSGNTQAFGNSLQMVRPAGRVVVASAYHGPAGDIALLPIMRKDMTIVGAKGPYVHTTPDGGSAPLQKLVELKDQLRKLIQVYDYKDALKGFEDMMSGASIKSVIEFKK